MIFPVRRKDALKLRCIVWEVNLSPFLNPQNTVIVHRFRVQPFRVKDKEDIENRYFRYKCLFFLIIADLTPNSVFELPMMTLFQ